MKDASLDYVDSEVRRNAVGIREMVESVCSKPHILTQKARQLGQTQTMIEVARRLGVPICAATDYERTVGTSMDGEMVVEWIVRAEESARLR